MLTAAGGFSRKAKQGRPKIFQIFGICKRNLRSESVIQRLGGGATAPEDLKDKRLHDLGPIKTVI